MRGSGLLIPALTAATALGANWLSTLGSKRVVREQAEVEAHAARVTAQRDRRREAYRDLNAHAHAFAAVLWAMERVDRAEPSGRAGMITAMKADSRESLNRLTKSSADVGMEGPAPVAADAGELLRLAVSVHLLLFDLVDGQDPGRGTYDRTYQEFTAQHSRFIGSAQEALAVV